MKNASYTLLLLLLAFAPLAFGCVDHWSLSVLEGIAFLATTCFFLERLVNRKPIYSVPGIIPLLLFLLFVLFQSIPIPREIIGVLSSNTLLLCRETVGITHPDIWLPLSVNIKTTLQEFFRYAAYGCLYLLTIHLLIDRKKMIFTIYFLVIFTTALSLFAIIQSFISPGAIYGILRIPEESRNFFGPYVNHNHFAGLVEMILPLTLGMFLYFKPKFIYQYSLKDSVLAFFDGGMRNGFILIGFSAIIQILAIVQSLSRGGLLSMIFALSVFLILLSLLRQSKKRLIFIGIFIFLAIIFINWLGIERIVERFNQLSNSQGEIYETRLDIWRSSLPIIKDFSVTGIGFGNFREIFPRYRLFTGVHSILHAHNDYLELLIEGGGISLFLIGWFVISVGMGSNKKKQRKADRMMEFVYIGALAGIISILIHSVVDFNLRIGANGLYFFFMLGLIGAATKINRGSTRTLLQTRLIVFTSVFGLLIISTIFNVRILLGNVLFESARLTSEQFSVTDKEHRRLVKLITRSLDFDPIEAKYHFALGSLYPAENKSLSLTDYSNAVLYTPLNGEYLQELGLALSSQGEHEKAELLIKQGIKNDSLNSKRIRFYANWLFLRGRKNDGINALEAAFATEHRLNRDVVNEYISYMIIRDLSVNAMTEVISDNFMPLVLLGNYFELIHNVDAAKTVYKKTIALFKSDLDKELWMLFRITDFYQSQSDYESVFKILILGMPYYSDNVFFRIRLAETYQVLGNDLKAIENLKVALKIDPDNLAAVRKLELLRGKNVN